MIKTHRRGNTPHALDRDERDETMANAKTLTPKEVAPKLGTTAKTLRKFLRKDEASIAAQNGGTTPQKGGRWAIPVSSLKSLQKRFDAWVAANTKEKDTDTESPEGDDEVEVLEETETVEGDTEGIDDEVA